MKFRLVLGLSLLSVQAMATSFQTSTNSEYEPLIDEETRETSSLSLLQFSIPNPLLGVFEPANKGGKYIQTRVRKMPNEIVMEAMGRTPNRGILFATYPGLDQVSFIRGLNNIPIAKVNGSLFSSSVCVTSDVPEWNVKALILDAKVHSHSRMPNQFEAEIPVFNEAEGTVERLKLVSKSPEWKPSVGYSLNFGGRVSQSSNKNLILVSERDPSAELLRFGRTGPNEFILDFKYPISPIQAFSFALSVLTKL